MKVVKPDKARILLYDIETSPNLAYVWGKYEQNVIAFEQEWYILCFAYKWLGEKRTHVVALPDFDLYKKDPTNDLEVVKKLWELFNEADILIAHNGDSFDVKKSQARMLVHGLTPPSSARLIDTKKVSRSNFNFNSNKLDDLGKILNLGSKQETGGFKLWLDCLAGKKSAWDKMKRYNRQDVVLLEQIYATMLPWIKNHPAMNLLEGKPDACPKCGSTKGMLSQGTRVNKVTRVQRWQCKSCGGWVQSRMVEATKEPVKFVN